MHCRTMSVTHPSTAKPSPGRDSLATELKVTGMNCNGCVQSVNRALQGVPGVARAEVWLEQAQARVRWQTDARDDVPRLVAAVTAAGYKAELIAVDAKMGSGKKAPVLSGW